jgi:hypothetical protein
MKSGILYVVFNKWIRDPKTGKTPYKIGITATSVEDRYYGLGLKMPGKFETRFAYRFDDCSKAEHIIHKLFDKHKENGEWFSINEKQIDLIKRNCEEALGGTPVTDEVTDDITAITETETGNNDDEQGFGTESFVNIKGVEIPLYRNVNESIQDFVKRTLDVMFAKNLLPETEINNMLDKQYCKDTFGIQFPIIQNDRTKLKDGKGHLRYWVKELFGNKYYGCSQWWKDLDSTYERKLSKWIKKIAELNKTQ